MAIPAHKTEYFIIENSNLQKKANTALLESANIVFMHSVKAKTFLCVYHTMT